MKFKLSCRRHFDILDFAGLVGMTTRQQHKIPSDYAHVLGLPIGIVKTPSVPDSQESTWIFCGVSWNDNKATA